MNFELVKTILLFLSGGFLIFLAITITRDNFANRLNRITGAMLFFAGLGPFFMALSGIVEPSTFDQAGAQSLPQYNIYFVWEFFFPLLLLFSWIFPDDRLRLYRHARLRYLIFLPQVMHLVTVLFFASFIGFLDLLKVDAVREGFSSIILKPFSYFISWLTLFLSLIQSYHEKIFGIVNLLYILAAIFFLESGRRYLTNPRLLTQTKVITWAARLSLGLYVLTSLGLIFYPGFITEDVSVALMLLALLVGSILLIYATIRYQFLDVRLVFRQSFVYSISSAILVGSYIVLVVQSKKFLEPLFGAQAQIISYAFIILMLLLFQPINNWLDEFIRSFFIRTRTDHRNVIERFSRHVISQFNPEQLRQIIDETLKTALLVEKVYYVIFDDKLGEYALQTSDDNPKKVTIMRDDAMLGGINLLDKPTFFHALEDYRENSALAELLEKRSVKLILPMKDAQHLLGFLALSGKAAGYTYSSEDFNLLGVLSNQMVTALTNARLYVDSLERMRLQEEVSMARQIQLDLLPAKPPDHPSLEIHAQSNPSRTVGGDFFDFININESKIGICIADASGKGMPAALMIAQTQAILRSEVNNGLPIKDALGNMNQQIVHASSSEKYVTLFYGELDTTSGWFEYSNAGHNYPILVHCDGSVDLLKTGGPIVGALPKMLYHSDRVQLTHNDLLFFFTDGLSEAMNELGHEYTEERIRDFLVNNRHLDTKPLVDALLADVRTVDPSDPPRDDTTVIAIKVKKEFGANG